MTKPSNCGGGGGGGARGQCDSSSAQLRALGEARRKGARLTRTEKGSVCVLGTPSEPENDSKVDM